MRGDHARLDRQPGAKSAKSDRGAQEAFLGEFPEDGGGHPSNGGYIRKTVDPGFRLPGAGEQDPGGNGPTGQPARQALLPGAFPGEEAAVAQEPPGLQGGAPQEPPFGSLSHGQDPVAGDWMETYPSTSSQQDFNPATTLVGKIGASRQKSVHFRVGHPVSVVAG